MIAEGTPVFALLAPGLDIFATVGERVDDTHVRVYDPDGYSFIVLESELELV